MVSFCNFNSYKMRITLSLFLKLFLFSLMIPRGFSKICPLLCEYFLFPFFMLVFREYNEFGQVHHDLWFSLDFTCVGSSKVLTSKKLMPMCTSLRVAVQGIHTILLKTVRKCTNLQNMSKQDDFLCHSVLFGLYLQSSCVAILSKGRLNLAID